MKAVWLPAAEKDSGLLLFRCRDPGVYDSRVVSLGLQRQ